MKPSEKVRFTASGWALPADDRYFHKFQTPFEYQGPGNVEPEKTNDNGFQRHHLWTAFFYVKRWDIAIDVGAHTGFWTWDMADKFKQVHAFEAHPVTCECLKLNMQSKPNAFIYHAAVGHERGKATVQSDPSPKRIGNSGSNFVRPNENGDVEMFPLDSLRFNGCDLLKIDVEGFELRVLEGARKLIEEHWPVVIMETDKRFHERYEGLDGQVATQWLESREYKEVARMQPDRIFVHSKHWRSGNPIPE